MAKLNFPVAKVLDGVLETFLASKTEKYQGESIMPLRTTAFHEIEFYVMPSSEGMTLAYTLDGDIGVIPMPGRTRKSFTPSYWKEKYILTEGDLLTLSKATGTVYEKETKENLIARAMGFIANRIKTRMEWMRWKGIIDGQLTLSINGVNTVAAMEINSTNINQEVETSWANSETCKPHNDIVDHLLYFRENIKKDPGQAWMNAMTASYLVKSDQIIKYFNGLYFGTAVTMANLSRFFETEIPGCKLVLYDETYHDDQNNTTGKFIPDGKIVFLPRDFSETASIMSTGSFHTSGSNPKGGPFTFLYDGTKKAGTDEDDGRVRVEIGGGIYAMAMFKDNNNHTVLNVKPS